jgi:DNA-directed RNA polymerase specialized sigma24 family protein
MPGSPVRLAVASANEAVAQGLRRMLAEQAHRVIVVDDGYDAVDVVLHDGDDLDDEPVQRRAGVAVWVPLRVEVEQLVAMVEAAARPAVPGVDLVGLIVGGLTNQEIADKVFVSINSVKTYIRSAYRKIGLSQDRRQQPEPGSGVGPPARDRPPPGVTPQRRSVCTVTIR